MMFESRNALLDQYDMKFVWLDLSVEDDSRDISGNVTITSEVVVAVMDTFALELDTLMFIDSVFINGTQVSNIIRQVDDLLLPLNQSLNTGDEVSARVYYHGTAREGINYWAGVSTDSSHTWNTSVTWTLSQPYQAKEWWPTKLDLQDKAASVWVFLTSDFVNMAGPQ